MIRPTRLDRPYELRAIQFPFNINVLCIILNVHNKLLWVFDHLAVLPVTLSKVPGHSVATSPQPAKAKHEINLTTNNSNNHWLVENMLHMSSTHWYSTENVWEGANDIIDMVAHRL